MDMRTLAQPLWLHRGLYGMGGLREESNRSGISRGAALAFNAEGPSHVEVG